MMRTDLRSDLVRKTDQIWSEKLIRFGQNRLGLFLDFIVENWWNLAKNRRIWLKKTSQYIRHLKKNKKLSDILACFLISKIF